MRSSLYLLFLLLAFMITVKASSTPQIVYQKVYRVNKTWSFRSAKAKGNVTYIDPYVWLEGKNDDKDIQHFVSDQLDITEKYIKGCKGKETIVNSLLEASTYDKYRHVKLITSNSGGASFYLYCIFRSGDQPPLWYTASVNEFQAAKKTNFITPPGKLFLNESLLSSDGSASISDTYTSNSPDGKIFGYLVVENGEVGKWYFRSFNSPLSHVKSFVPGGEGRLKDILDLTGDYISWTPDSKGILYPQTIDPNGGTATSGNGYKIRYHVWGTDNSKDVTIFDSKDAGEHGEDSYYFNLISPDGEWLVISGYYDVSSMNMATYATRLKGQTISGNMKWISLAPSYDFSMYPAGVIGDSYYFATNKNATNLKAAKIKLDWSKARQVKSFTELQDRPAVIDVVKERKGATIDYFGITATAKDKLVLVYIEKGYSTAYLHDAKTGKLIQQLAPDLIGKIFEISTDQNSTDFILQGSSYATPNANFEFVWNKDHLESSTVTIRKIKGSDPNDFTVERLFATSKDGTKVPYFITHKKGKKKNGKSPCWVHFYAAYGQNDNLYYRPEYFDFLRSYDGYFIWAGARGGADEGGTWHDKGSGLNKQKTFDDILAIAQDLIKLGYTSAGNLIIEGGSAGGTATCAVMNQAPAGMIGAAFPTGAPCDIFLFELRTTLGINNRAEFGDVTTPEGFDAVFPWSPQQNVVPNKPYPAVLMGIGSGDERVPPSSTYKFISQLQYDNPNNKAPLLMYVAENKNHVPATIDESSYQFCILEQALGLKRTTN